MMAADRERFVDTRLQLHWAAQTAAGVGRTVRPRLDDLSHESFVWSPEHRALLQGLAASGARPFRAGIRLHDLTLLVAGEDGAIEREFPMNGRTLADGYAFFAERAGVDALAHPPEGMPDHPVAHGGMFYAHADDLAELSAAYTDAAASLEIVRGTEAGAGPVRCWPHHFDIATLITLRGSGKDAHTIGVGMAPGDASYRDPYYYVTPWPYPRDATPPALADAQWHTEGWFGAVLLVRDGASRDAFLREAVQFCRTLA